MPTPDELVKRFEERQARKATDEEREALSTMANSAEEVEANIKKAVREGALTQEQADARLGGSGLRAVPDLPSVGPSAALEPSLNLMGMGVAALPDGTRVLQIECQLLIPLNSEGANGLADALRSDVLVPVPDPAG